jgi:hypothetical protein
MTFEIGIHFLMARGGINIEDIPLKGNSTFKISNDKENLFLTLTENDGSIWDCPNKHYLKIICSPRNKATKAVLSLSKNQNGKGLINIRFAQFTQIGNKKAFEYYYGKIDQSDDARKWRR